MQKQQMDTTAPACSDTTSIRSMPTEHPVSPEVANDAAGCYTAVQMNINFCQAICQTNCIYHVTLKKLMQLALVILQPAILLPGSQDKAHPDRLLWLEFYERKLIKMYAGTYSHHLNLHFTQTYYGVCQHNHICVCT